MKKNLGKIAYKVAGVLLVLYGITYGLTAALPKLPLLEQSSRNLFYHVPMWFSMVVLMAISVTYSIRHLLALDPDKLNPEAASRFDAGALAAASVGVVFNALGLVTGMVWSRVSWGENAPASAFSAWWVWDPIQVCALIAFLIYLAYFLLRASYSNNEMKGRMAAVYNIFAFATLIPLFFIIPKMLPGLHPTAEGEGNVIFDKSNISNEYRMILYPTMLGFILIGVWAFELRYRAAQVSLRLQTLIRNQSYLAETTTSS